MPTKAGFLYLAVVLDAWSCRIVDWAMANHLRAELVLDALEMAIGQRHPRGVVLHSDQGSQYTSLAFGMRCKEAGVRPSPPAPAGAFLHRCPPLHMGSVGDAYDNAMAESFFTSLECELLERRRSSSQAEARMACFSYIEGFYNPGACTRPSAIAHPSATRSNTARCPSSLDHQIPKTVYAWFMC